jgi:hypothetical protein
MGGSGVGAALTLWRGSGNSVGAPEQRGQAAPAASRAGRTAFQSATPGIFLYFFLLFLFRGYEKALNHERRKEEKR